MWFRLLAKIAVEFRQYLSGSEVTVSSGCCDLLYVSVCPSLSPENILIRPKHLHQVYLGY